MFTFPSNQQDLEWRVIVFNVPPELDTGYFLPAIMDCSTLSSGSFHLFWAPLPCSVFSRPESWLTKESGSCREAGANLFSIWLATHYTIRPSSVILFIAKMGNFSVKRELPIRMILNLSPFYERSNTICLVMDRSPHYCQEEPSVNKKWGTAGDTRLLGIQLSLRRASFTASVSWCDSVWLVTVDTVTASSSRSSSHWSHTSL